MIVRVCTYRESHNRRLAQKLDLYCDGVQDGDCRLMFSEPNLGLTDSLGSRFLHHLFARNHMLFLIRHGSARMTDRYVSCSLPLMFRDHDACHLFCRKAKAVASAAALRLTEL